MNSYDDYEEYEERFSRRKDRRKPKGKRSVKELHVKKEEARDSAQVFSEESLQTLYERGFLSEILGELKSGKEATVYLATGPQGLIAAKIYSDMTVRSFRNDQKYREGRFIADKRIKKAIDQRSLNGVAAQQAMWVYYEYTQLWALFEAGVSVPKPMVGPNSDDMVAAGRTVLMEFIGTEDHAAPRLSDVRLSPEDAQRAWEQSLDIMVQLLDLGKIHGDFSTYNLLWWRDDVVIIDFPQMVDIEENRNALTLLEQDVNSLCLSFKRHGVREDPRKVLRDVKARSTGEALKEAMVKKVLL